MGFGGPALVAFFVIVLVGIWRQPSTALVILALLALAGLCVVGVFALEFGYLRGATIVADATGLRLTGVPSGRPRKSPPPARFDRATLEFGRRVQRKAWIAVDSSGLPLFWTYADFCDEDAITHLTAATGASVSGSWADVVPKPAARRW